MIFLLRNSPFLQINIQDSLLVHAYRPKWRGSWFQATPITSWSFVQFAWPRDRLSGMPDNIVISSATVSRIATTGRCLPTHCSPQCGLYTYSLPCNDENKRPIITTDVSVHTYKWRLTNGKLRHGVLASCMQDFTFTTVSYVKKMRWILDLPVALPRRFWSPCSSYPVTSACKTARIWVASSPLCTEASYCPVTNGTNETRLEREQLVSTNFYNYDQSGERVYLRDSFNHPCKLRRGRPGQPNRNSSRSVAAPRSLWTAWWYCRRRLVAVPLDISGRAWKLSGACSKRIYFNVDNICMQCI